jgi:hypothetical protein
MSARTRILRVLELPCILLLHLTILSHSQRPCLCFSVLHGVAQVHANPHIVSVSPCWPLFYITTLDVRTLYQKSPASLTLRLRSPSERAASNPSADPGRVPCDQKFGHFGKLSMLPHSLPHGFAPTMLRADLPLQLPTPCCCGGTRHNITLFVSHMSPILTASVVALSFVRLRNAVPYLVWPLHAAAIYRPAETAR